MSVPSTSSGDSACMPDYPRTDCGEGNVQDQYGAIAGWYDALYGNGIPGDLAQICEAIGSQERRRVLDVGCGTGRVLCHLMRSGHEVIGIDVSRRMVEIANRRIEANRASGKEYGMARVGVFPAAALERNCAAVVASFNVLNEVLSEASLRSVTAGALQCLGTGGRLLGHVVDLDGALNLESGVHLLRRRKDNKGVRNIHPELHSLEEDLIDVPSLRMVRRVRIFRRGDGGESTVVEHSIARRYWTLQRIQEVLTSVGFASVTVVRRKYSAREDEWESIAGAVSSAFVIAEGG